MLQDKTIKTKNVKDSAYQNVCIKIAKVKCGDCKNNNSMIGKVFL